VCFAVIERFLFRYILLLNLKSSNVGFGFARLDKKLLLRATMSGLRSWSAKKKVESDTTKVEEFSAPEKDTDLRSWSKSSKVAPAEAVEDDGRQKSMVLSALQNDPSQESVFKQTGHSNLKDAIVKNVKKVQKGKETWAKVRDAHEKGESVFKGAKKRNSMKKILNDTHKHERDRTHSLTEKIDEIRIQQAGKMKEKIDAQKEKEAKDLKRAKRKWYKAPINPRHPAKETWDLVCVCLVLFSAVEIPLSLAFPQEPGLEKTIEVLIDWIFILDVCLCFRTGYELKNGDIQLDSKLIINNYLSGWFPIDFLACFPLEILFAGSAESGEENVKLTTLLRLLKLPRLLRLGRIFKYIERFKYAGAMKILRFILGIIMIAHWVGCAFFFIMNLEGELGRGTWLEENVGLNPQGLSLMNQYSTLMYAAFKMLIGEGMDMVTPYEKAYGTFVLLLGTVVTAVIVGQVSFVVSNQNSTSYQYQSKMDMVTDEMRALNLPPELMDRTLAYYEYLWNRHRTFDPSRARFTNDLSPTLRSEILLHMNKDVIIHCSFFRKCSNECILRLVHAFRYRVFLADDVLAEEGQASQDMVFIVHGTARIMQQGHRMPLGLLVVGDYFGEKSLLMHHRNAVSIIANANCDTRVLMKRDFEDICIDFPDLRDEITKVSKHNDVTETGTNFRSDTSVGGESSSVTEVGKKRRRSVVETRMPLSEYSFDSVASRPASSNQAARIIEVISSVHLMRDSLDTLINDSNNTNSRIASLEKKLDSLRTK